MTQTQELEWATTTNVKKDAQIEALTNKLIKANGKITDARQTINSLYTLYDFNDDRRDPFLLDTLAAIEDLLNNVE